MFERLLMLYREGRLSDEGLSKAVGMRWITAEQAEEIKTEEAEIFEVKDD